jgi:hypothetical protein
MLDGAREVAAGDTGTETPEAASLSAATDATGEGVGGMLEAAVSGRLLATWLATSSSASRSAAGGVGERIEALRLSGGGVGDRTEASESGSDRGVGAKVDDAAAAEWLPSASSLSSA